MMSIEEKRRQMFEPIANGYQMEMERWGDGYYFVDTQNAWEIFNAALDVVVIDLPAVFGDTHHEISGAIDYRCAVRAAIESTGFGLKVKL